MATVDLRPLSDQEFVFHFGGEPNEIDAFTFGNSILALSESLREINVQINPDFSLEVVIEAIGGGSFRAQLRTKAKKLSSLFKDSAKHLIIGILAAMIYEKVFGDKIQVIVNDDSYIIQRGDDRIVLPREIHTAMQAMKSPEVVDNHISRAFEVLNEDPSISGFGITRKITDPLPLAIIPREDFGRLAEPGLLSKPDPAKRTKDEEASLVIVKAILERSTRRWQFIWNGHRISAPITDPTFYTRLAAREFEFGQGDILKAILTIHQTRDDATGAYLNEKYEVTKVIGRTPGTPRQIDLLGN